MPTNDDSHAGKTGNALSDVTVFEETQISILLNKA